MRPGLQVRRQSSAARGLGCKRGHFCPLRALLAVTASSFSLAFSGSFVRTSETARRPRRRRSPVPHPRKWRVGGAAFTRWPESTSHDPAISFGAYGERWRPISSHLARLTGAQFPNCCRLGTITLPPSAAHPLCPPCPSVFLSHAVRHAIVSPTTAWELERGDALADHGR